MQAVVLHAFGSHENLRPEIVPDPSPGPGEVLLKVHACGVCHHDVMHRRGHLPHTPVPAILGHEVAGEVVDVGAGVDGWSLGDRAATLQRLSCGDCHHCRIDRSSLCKEDRRFFGEELPGGYAEYMVAPVAGIGRLAPSVPWEVAATACCTAGTAVHTVRTRGRVRAGESVVVTGASGGVGLQVVQLARHCGARVLAVTSGEAKVEALREAGADEVIVAPDLEFGSQVRRLTDGHGVDVVIEIVGAATFQQSLKCLTPGGRLVIVGNLEAGIVQLNPGLTIVKELEILGAYATTQGELQEALELIEHGVLRPWVSDVLPLTDACHAHAHLEERAVVGRLVLSPVN